MTTNVRAHSPVFLDPRQGSGYGSLNPTQYHKDGGDCGIYNCISDVEEELNAEELEDPNLYDDLDIEYKCRDGEHKAVKMYCYLMVAFALII